MAWVLAWPSREEPEECPGDVLGPRARRGLDLFGQARHRGPGKATPARQMRSPPSGAIVGSSPTADRQRHDDFVVAEDEPRPERLVRRPSPATRAGQPRLAPSARRPR